LLSFARAVLAAPRILILDEATSNIDTRTEAIIQRALGTLLEGRTSIVIAHRLSTIRSADLILVVAEGRIAEDGTHAQLWRRMASTPTSTDASSASRSRRLTESRARRVAVSCSMDP
jgi:ABC-type multidrug transport system fused ATPase/permease subunit